ncbi:hypothetical protein ACH5A7_18220 [Streptomyces sp. NPDC018955]|uniref:hypothetical protein n=1 Tax=Streptomyces sp. NPDC018955 TaxID=3365055 RepID=UPI0037B6A61F
MSDGLDASDTAPTDDPHVAVTSDADGDAGPAADPDPAGRGAEPPLTPCLASWLEDAGELARHHGLEAVRRDIEVLAAQAARPSFRVTVAGEAASGKSSLVNRLLGRSVLPEDHPVAVPVSVVAGTDECVELLHGDEVRRYAWGEEAWRAAAGGRDGDDPAEAPHAVRVVVDDRLLGDGAVELIEAPRLNSSLVGDELARRTVRISDALVMTTKAIAPLGLTEAGFLGEAVGRAHLPHVTLVLTMTDLLGREDRRKTVENVVTRAARVDPRLGVSVGPHHEDEADLAVLRSRISAWATADERHDLRRRQIAAQLADQLRRMADIGREALRAARLRAEEREETRREELAEADRMRLERAGARVEFDERRSSAVAELGRRLDSAHDELLGELRTSLEAAPDAKWWWDTSLSLVLRHGLERLAKRQEHWLHARVADDVAWLEERVSATGGEGTPIGYDGSDRLDVNEPARNRLHVQDLRGKDALYRFGPAGAALLAALVIPGVGLPIALIGAGAAAVAGGVRFRQLEEEQKAVVDEALRHIVDQAVDEFTGDAGHRLRDIYAEISDRALERWRARQDDRTAAPAPVTDEDAGRWALLVETAEELRDRITTAPAV